MHHRLHSMQSSGLTGNNRVGPSMLMTWLRWCLLCIVITLSAITLSLLSGLSHPTPAKATTNGTLNFQARLLTSAGALIPDGTYNVEFKIYDSASANASAQGVCSLNSSTDDCWWLETRTGANKVTVKNGYISANLGSVTAFGSSIPWDQDLYLTINIGGTGTPSWDGEMLATGSVRMKISGVPYAFAAGKLQATSGSNSTNITITTPTGTRSILFPDAGGTVALAGSGSFTSNGVLYGNGTSSIQATAAGTTGQCLVATTGSAPSWGTCAGTGSGVTLQAAYNNSTSPEITLNSTNGALTIHNDATNSIAGNLLEVQDNAGTTTFFGVTKTGISATVGYTQTGTGANTFSGASSFTAAGTALSVTNNATVGGTLGVTGAGTFSSTLNVAAAGGYYYGGTSSPLSVELTRTVPTTVNDIVEIGNFSLTNGAHNFRISVTVPSSAFSVAKQYIVPVKYDATANTWYKLTPTTDSSSYAGNDYDLDINVATNTAYLRLRRTSGATAGTAYIRIESTSYTSDVFTATSSTASVSAPTSLYGQIYQNVVGNVGVGTTGTPASLLSVGGTTGNFQVNSSGQVVAGTWQGSTIGVSYGGTGAGTFTSNGILYGNGTSAIQVTAAGTTGQCLNGNTGSAPTWGSCGGSGVTTVGALDAGTANANAAYISGTNIYMQSASASFAGVVNTTTQTLAGAKTFSGAATFSAAGTALSVTNNANVGGTLGVTGLLTASTGLTVNGADLNLGAGVTLNSSNATGSATDPWTSITTYTTPIKLIGTYGTTFYTQDDGGGDHINVYSGRWASDWRWSRSSAGGFQKIAELTGGDTDQHFNIYDGTTSTVDIHMSTTGASYLNTGFNVGIGDTTPAALLTVGNGDLFQVNSSGAIAASTGIANSGGYVQSGSTANTFTGATTLSASGRAVTVYGGYGAPQALITSDNSNGIFFQADGSSAHYNWLIGQQRTVSTALEFTPSTATGGTTFTTPTMVLLAGGNVGIGDTSPAALLTVGNGDLFQVNSSGTVSTTSTITASSTSNSVFGNGTTGGVQIGDGTITKTSGGNFVLNSGIVANGGYSQSNPTANNFSGATTVSSGSLTVSNASASGINITGSNPQIQLANAALGYASGPGSYSAIAATNDVVLRNVTGGIILAAENASGGVTISTGVTDSAKLTVLNGGNVGIGTTSPAEKLHVVVNVGGTGTIARFGNLGDSNRGLIIAERSYTTALQTIQEGDGTAFGNLVIQPDGGNVGIGDTTPAALLTVGNGDLFQVNSSGQTSYVNGTTNTATLVCKNSSGQLAGCNTTGAGVAFLNGGNSFGSTAVLGTNDAQALYLQTNGATRLAVSSAGTFDFQANKLTNGYIGTDGVANYMNIGGITDNIIRANEKYTVTADGAFTGTQYMFDGNDGTSEQVTVANVNSANRAVTIDLGAVQHYWYGMKVHFVWGDYANADSFKLEYYSNNAYDGNCANGTNSWVTIADVTGFTGYDYYTPASFSWACKIRLTLRHSNATNGGAGSPLVMIGEISAYQKYYGDKGLYVKTTGDTIYGDVIIGTAATSRNLTVKGYENVTEVLRVGANSGGGTVGDIVSRRSSNTGAYYFGDSVTNYLFFDGTNYVFGLSSLYANTSGNVGIGDTTPAALFTVGNGDLFQVSSGGNVTIGATSGTGLNINNAGITTDISLQNGETIDNNVDGTIQLTASITQLSGNLKVSNGNWLTSIDGAGTGLVNMFSANANNEIQVGAALSVDGGIVLPTNGGQLTLADLPIDSSAAASTPESYTFRVGSSNALTVYGQADGSGNAQNIRVAVGSSISPAYTLDVTGDIHTTAQIYADGSASIYGAVSVNGMKGSYGGINFRSGSTNFGTLMVNSDYQGFFNDADNGWDWYFTNGTLTAGSIPIANLTGLTTNGDLAYNNGTTVARLARGSNGQCLTSNATTLLWSSCGAGISAIGTLDSVTKSANGAVVSGSNLILQTADGTYPGLVSTGTQTFAGVKTFGAAGTALTVNNNATIGGNLTVGSTTSYGSGALVDIGSAAIDYQGNSGWFGSWNSNLLLSGLDTTTITFHDAGTSLGALGHIASNFFFDGAGSWGPISLGVNDRSPDAFLDVTGNGSGVALRVDDSGEGDSTPFIITSNGNVGIGTNAPAGAKLDVYNPATTGSLNYATFSYLSHNTTGSGTYYNFGSQTSGWESVSSGQTNSGYMIASDNQAWLNGASTGTLSTLMGIRDQVGMYTGSAGTITAAYGLTIDVLNYGSGAITNGYGLMINDVQASTGYGIYQGGSNDYNFLAGQNIFSNYTIGSGASTATTGTTEATARTNVTTVTLTAAGSFANNDIIFINNAGQDYYTRIVSGGGTTTLTVSPAVSYDVSASVTKYNTQNIGATTTDYTTLNNRFFQGYFLGGIVTGAGSTSYSDQNITSSGPFVVKDTTNSAAAFSVRDANDTSVLSIDTAISTNLITNPSFEKDTTGWAVYNSLPGGNMTRSTSEKYSNAASMQIDPNGGSANQGVKFALPQLTAGTAYTFSVYAKGTVTYPLIGYSCTGASEDLSSSSLAGSPSSWTRWTFSFTTCGTTSSSNFVFIRQNGTASGDNFYVDGAMLETGSAPTEFRSSQISSELAVQSTGSATGLQIMGTKTGEFTPGAPSTTTPFTTSSHIGPTTGLGDFNMGYQFTVSQSGSVTQLGNLCPYTSETVRLYDVYGNVLAVAVVNPSSWTAITPVGLSANQTYYVSGRASSFCYNTFSTPQVIGPVTINGSYYISGSDAVPNISLLGAMYGYVDITYQVGGLSSPQSIYSTSASFAGKVNITANGLKEGLNIDGVQNPSLSFSNAGAVQGYFGVGTYFSNAGSSDLVMRGEAGTLQLGVGSGASTVRIGNAGTYLNGSTSFGGTITAPNITSGGGSYYVMVDASGNFIKNVSSARYKTNIQPLQDDFSRILQVQPKSYNYISSGQADIGVIAEELDALGLHNLVVYDEQGRPDAVRYDKIPLYNLMVIKNQELRINQLESNFANFLSNGDDASFSSLNATGPVSFNNLLVNGDAFIAGKLSVSEVEVTANLTVNGKLVAKGDAEFGADLKLAGTVGQRNAITKKFKASKPITAGSVVMADASKDGYIITVPTAGSTAVLGVAVTEARAVDDEVEVAIGGIVQVRLDIPLDPHTHLPLTDYVVNGSLIVSSHTEGQAAVNATPTVGALVGKALGKADPTSNLVWMLVSLN